MVCPACEGDGIERCTNPDHGFIQGLSFTDMGRIGCPYCQKESDDYWQEQWDELDRDIMAGIRDARFRY